MLDGRKKALNIPSQFFEQDFAVFFSGSLGSSFSVLFSAFLSPNLSVKHAVLYTRWRMNHVTANHEKIWFSFLNDNFPIQDLHLVNMEDFRYGGTNITAFRLVDPNNPLVQEVVRWVPTSLPSAWWILTTL